MQRLVSEEKKGRIPQTFESVRKICEGSRLHDVRNKALQLLCVFRKPSPSSVLKS